MIEKTAAMNAPLLVLVCGADPHQSLQTSRDQIREGIEAILPVAKEFNIKLGIEPLHPMYSDTRSAINTIEQANNMVEQFQSSHLGVVVDVYHLWWDPNLAKEIKRCGENNNLFAFHLSDWLTPTTDLLYDRGIMGDGCIPIKRIRGWVEAADFAGYHEVEIFSKKHWSEDQEQFVNKIVDAYLKYS
jgi:sugar phosphate isomerase/epimerase